MDNLSNDTVGLRPGVLRHDVETRNIRHSFTRNISFRFTRDMISFRDQVFFLLSSQIQPPTPPSSASLDVTKSRTRFSPVEDHGTNREEKSDTCPVHQARLQRRRSRTQDTGAESFVSESAKYEKASRGRHDDAGRVSCVSIVLCPLLCNRAGQKRK